MNLPKVVFEFVVALAVLIGGVTAALNGVTGWGLALTGTLLLSASLIVHGQALPQRVRAR
ncbi:hypothetical protein [Ferrimonas sp. YFM]|uniref:hypothetical protein n=1 Tax=Ferrimonas sp. YFM TaxID=3028878 RepID=UPI0025745E09|nr:hypothetical protein [Ferrimonas sp. YFM]BDY05421.1 hypothetical protein F0521_24620 [Ferrimonas sp. YFM]